MQAHVAVIVAACPDASSPMAQMYLQPYVAEAATVCGGGCNPMGYRVEEPHHPPLVLGRLAFARR